ncbi:capsular polysaccharide export protein, LipB/KpsS family [Novacetimonas maltaceti]|uniref:Uncharacterized protein n=1 Tax=Novacetimonas maltaceti TaxID=1203393 RepID=A0A2S3VZK9_9PROT|nr:hypothetical protein [Novacetimonas maltaceti]POF62051.1 hypothetical protein KMAL_23320 [Novacetimonas maltaceti]
MNKKILFFLEPVFFRGSPHELLGHFPWMTCFQNFCLENDCTFAIVTNDTLNAKWFSERGIDPSTTLFAVDPFLVLKSFDYDKSQYFEAAYGRSQRPNFLSGRLAAIRDEFAPDLVVMSVQNEIARAAFAGIPVLSIEQSPLPRFSHMFRTSFDPCGHQVGSFIETHHDTLRTRVLPPAMQRQALMLRDMIADNLRQRDDINGAAIAKFHELRRDGRIALLITQPPDYPTYEGAYKPISMESLIYSWAQQLPEGWIGIPTYYKGPQTYPSQEMEAALSLSCPQLRFLPPELAVGHSETLLLHADAMVTISSTTAMTGLLFQKPVIVTGRSPYNAWCPQDPAALATPQVLSDSEVASLLCFLTGRYSATLQELQDSSQRIGDIVRVMTQGGDPAAWFLDTAEWSLYRASRLFSFNTCIDGAWGAVKGCERKALLERLSRETDRRQELEGELAALHDRLGALENEHAQLSGQEQQGRERILALEGELAKVVALEQQARERAHALEGELAKVAALEQQARERAHALEGEHAKVVALEQQARERAHALEGEHAKVAALEQQGRERIRALEEERLGHEHYRTAAAQRISSLESENARLGQEVSGLRTAGDDLSALQGETARRLHESEKEASRYRTAFVTMESVFTSMYDMVREREMDITAKFHLSQARRNARKGMWEKAAYHYRKFLRDHPEDLRAWVQYGHALKESGDMPAATRAYCVADAIEQVKDGS